MLGGVLACGLTHAGITPLDVAKCNMQVSLSRPSYLPSCLIFQTGEPRQVQGSYLWSRHTRSRGGSDWYLERLWPHPCRLLSTRHVQVWSL